MPIQNIGNQQVTTFNAIPKGFNPLTATPAEITTYGLPARPNATTDPVGYNNYAKMFASLASMTVVVPEFRLGTSVHDPKTNTEINMKYGTGQSWGGYVATPAGPNETFNFVQSQILVVAASGGASVFAIVSAWVGIDGSESSDVAQAGYSTWTTPAGFTTSPWFEWYPNLPVVILNMNLNAGDTIEVSLFVLSPTSVFCIYKNVTKQTAVVFTITAPGSTTLKGNCAEAIVESPAGEFFPLPNFDCVLFNNVAASTNKQNYLLVNPNYEFDLTDGNNNCDVKPFPLSSSSFFCAHGNFGTNIPRANIPQANKNDVFDQITFNINTGGDDLRGDSSATATVSLPNGPQTFTLKAQSDSGWGNNTFISKTFPITGNPLGSQFYSVMITLTSHDSLFETPDNWNIQLMEIGSSGKRVGDFGALQGDFTR
jgi:hypothetical protein